MRDLQRSLRWLVAATVVLWLVVVAFGAASYVVAARTHDALCTLRADLEQRVDSSRDFLKTHPDGIPGIPRATFDQGIANQERTIDALHELGCRDVD